MLLLLILACLIPVSASAAEGPGCIGLAFSGFPAGENGSSLLEEMARRDVRATFFLDIPTWEDGKRILEGGHEIGLTAPEDWNRLSRRGVYRQLNGLRALLPDRRVHILLAEGRVSDGVGQVAEVQKMEFLQNARDPWAEPRMGSTFLGQVKGGDVLLLDGENIRLNLNLMDILQARGFRLVSVSELSWFDRW